MGVPADAVLLDVGRFRAPSGLQILKNEKSQGRLLVPGYYSTSQIYDNGVWGTKAFSWPPTTAARAGKGYVPQTVFEELVGIAGNENQVVELPDGSLLVNSRTWAGSRIQARSEDGGETWTRFARTGRQPVAGLPGQHGGGARRRAALLGCHRLPWYYFDRSRLTLMESTDKGESWQESELQEGPASYSSMVRLLDGTVAIDYETAPRHHWMFVPEKIVFQILETGRAPTPNFYRL